jgi:hypothetical protein
MKYFKSSLRVICLCTFDLPSTSEFLGLLKLHRHEVRVQSETAKERPRFIMDCSVNVVVVMVVFREQYKLCISSLYSVQHFPITTAVLGPDIFSAPCYRKDSAYILALKHNSISKVQINII